jgi:ABC-type sugar transport system substrate-binding protein
LLKIKSELEVWIVKKGVKQVAMMSAVTLMGVSTLAGCGTAKSTSASSNSSNGNSTASTSSASSQPVPKTVADLSKFTNLDSSGKPIKPNFTVAFAETDLNSPWRVSEMSDFKTYAQKLGVKLIWNQANESVSTELSNVQDLIAKKPDVLIVDPEATAPLTPVINMASSAHIPLIVVDRGLSKQPGEGTYQLFIGADQKVIGYQSAEWWIKKLQQQQHTQSPKANLAIIEGGVGQDPTTERNQGVMDAIKPYPGIKVVATESGDWTLQGGRQVMQGYIQKYPKGTLQGVFAASDEMMLGALEALQAANRTDLNGWFFTGDGQLEGLEQIVNGVDIADTQNPPFYGQSGLEAAIAISQGVNFNGATINLPNETFTNMTPSESQKTKDYVSKAKSANSDF